jgi:hypothetical protein
MRKLWTTLDTGEKVFMIAFLIFIIICTICLVQTFIICPWQVTILEGIGIFNPLY